MIRHRNDPCDLREPYTGVPDPGVGPELIIVKVIPIRSHELVPEVLAGVGSIIVQKHEFDKLTVGKEIHCYALTILAGHVVEVGHRQIHGVYEVTFPSFRPRYGQGTPCTETDRVRSIRDRRTAVTHRCGELDRVAITGELHIG